MPHSRFSLLSILFLIAGCTPFAEPQSTNLPHSDEISSDLSTPLNDRFEAITEDPYCWNIDESKESLDSFLGAQFGDSSVILDSINASLAENSQRKTLSVCRYAEEAYVLEYQGGGQEFEGYRVYTASSADSQFEIGAFIAPMGRVMKLSTQLFADEDMLGMSARSGDASYTSWYYYTVGTEANSVTQVEWCDRYFGGGWSPYGDEPTLNCEYRYDPSAQ